MFRGTRAVPDFDLPCSRPRAKTTPSRTTTTPISTSPCRATTSRRPCGSRATAWRARHHPEKLATEKKVVIEEFRQRYLNQPYGDQTMLLRALAYHALRSGGSRPSPTGRRPRRPSRRSRRRPKRGGWRSNATFRPRPSPSPSAWAGAHLRRLPHGRPRLRPAGRRRLVAAPPPSGQGAAPARLGQRLRLGRRRPGLFIFTGQLLPQTTPEQAERRSATKSKRSAAARRRPRNSRR